MIDLIPNVTFNNDEKQIYGPLAGAILGSLIGSISAFLLVIARDFNKNISSRKKKHYNALIRMNRLLISQRKNIEDNLFILPNFAKALKKGSLYFNTFHLVEMDENILVDLHNLPLINKIGNYFDILHDDNTDLDNFQRGYSNLEAALLNGNLSKKDFDSNMIMMGNKMLQLEIRMRDTLKANLAMQLMVNDLIDKDLTLSMKVAHKLVGQTSVSLEDYLEKTEKQYEKRHKVIQERIKNVK